MAADEVALRRDVACPFCGLGCDDLAIATRGGRLEVAAAGCARSREQLDALQSARDAEPAADRSVAVTRAAELIASSRAPVFVVAADVAATRAALALADRLGGVLDHPDSDALFHNLSIVQDSGALTTTLSEVRNRADVVLVVGPDPTAAVPRFYERCIDAPRTLFADGAPARTFLRLGPPVQGVADASGAPRADEITCSMDRLPEAIAALRAAMLDAPSAALDLPGVAPGRLAEVAARLRAARYALVVWAPALFDHGALLVAHGLLELVRTATRTTRASLLALGGSGNLFGVNQVCTWQSGYPLRTSFGSGIPEHDPYRYSARRMIAAGEADAVVWVSAFDPTGMPPESGVPTILLAPPGAAAAARVAAYVPIGTPGVDHDGQIFRTDGVVALQLRALRASALPAAASVLNEIADSVAQDRGKMPLPRRTSGGSGILPRSDGRSGILPRSGPA